MQMTFDRLPLVDPIDPPRINRSRLRRAPPVDWIEARYGADDEITMPMRRAPGLSGDAEPALPRRAPRLKR